MAHEQHQELIQALHDCAAECNHCFDACLQEEDVKMTIMKVLAGLLLSRVSLFLVSFSCCCSG